jgi:iron complex transport system substrate-binding protein
MAYMPKPYGQERKKMKTARWSKRLGALALSVVMAAALAACGNSGSKAADSGAAAGAGTQAPSVNLITPAKAEGTALPTPQAAQTAYPLTIKDATGTDVTFDKAPERVVTLAPSETEVLFAVGAGDKVVGVDSFSDYPEEAKTKAKIGDMKANLEAVLAQKPDVVFAQASMSKESVQKLRDLKVKVFATDPKTLDQVIEKIETVGKIMNMQAGSAKVAEQMRQDKQRVTDAVKDAPKKKVYMEFSPGWTVGKGEFMDELVTLAGGINVAGDQQGWFEVNGEKIIKSNPDVILYSKGPMVGDTISDAILKRPGFAELAAVKEKRMFPVNEDLVSRVGPRLTQALVAMAKAIHPEAVK